MDGIKAYLHIDFQRLNNLEVRDDACWSQFIHGESFWMGRNGITSEENKTDSWFEYEILRSVHLVLL